MAFTMNSSPQGWLICDGSEIYRSQYPNLFSVIGTSFGAGDGVYTFNLPDYRGAFLRGTGTHNGYSGPNLNTSQTDSFKSHNHTAHSTVTDPGHTHVLKSANDDFNNTSGNSLNPPNYNYPVGSYPSFAAYDTGDRSWNNVLNTTTGITVNTTIDLSGNPNETRPYNFGVYWIIKA